MQQCPYCKTDHQNKRLFSTHLANEHPQQPEPRFILRLADRIFDYESSRGCYFRGEQLDEFRRAAYECAMVTKTDGLPSMQWSNQAFNYYRKRYEDDFNEIADLDPTAYKET